LQALKNGLEAAFGHELMADKQAWLARYNRVAAAQAKYLWALLVVGVFCWVTTHPATISSAAPQPFSAPLLNIPVSSDAVLAASPAVILFLQLVIFGTLRAASKAEDSLKPEKIGETDDEHWNAIDWAVYTTIKAKGWVKKTASFAYPVYMLVFTTEALYFLYRLIATRAVISGRWLFVGIATIEAVIVAILTVGFWLGRIRRINAEIFGWRLPQGLQIKEERPHSKIKKE
jgi:hypothetical protein